MALLATLQTTHVSVVVVVVVDAATKSKPTTPKRLESTLLRKIDSMQHQQQQNEEPCSLGPSPPTAAPSPSSAGSTPRTTAEWNADSSTNSFANNSRSMNDHEEVGAVSSRRRRGRSSSHSVRCVASNANNNNGSSSGSVLTAALLLLLATTTFTTSSSSAARMIASASDIPKGLVFSSDFLPNHGVSKDSTNKQGRGLNTEHSSAPTFSPRDLLSEVTLPDDSNNNLDIGIYQSEEPPTRSSHPIHRIYKQNAHIRRRMEELENSTPYFQTGIRGDPDFTLEYKNHPFDLMRKERERGFKEGGKTNNNNNNNSGEQEERTLQDESENSPPPEQDPFKPIRIHFDTSALDDERTTSNGAKIDFVKNIILPRMEDFWSSALSVVPVEGNLLVSTADLQGRVYCGDTEFAKVPSSHISTGVAGADLVLYVSGAPSTRFCGPSTLAVAVACNFDQFDRPTAGAVNFCLDQIELNEDGLASESVIEDNVDVAVHEAAHVLGMSSNSYRFFWDPDTGLERTYRPFSAKTVVCVDGVERTLILPSDNTMKFFIASNGQRYASIVTPKVATVARNQFNCQELNGAQLENQPTGENSCTGDHWDERMFYPELLSGVISPTTNYLSPLTLALLEDSGWYKANYTKSHVSPWGHGVGCPFVSSPCLVGGGNGRDGAVPSYGKGFFCNKASSRGCSPGYTHKMACTVIDYSLRGEYMPAAQFQYFGDTGVGGPREGDYCPVYGSVYSGLKAEQLDCRIPANDDAIDVIYSEEYGDNSMCFETTSGEGRCYNARCIYQDFNLQLQVDGKWYTCEEDFQQIAVSTLSGAFGTTVTCPRLSSVCPDMFCPANCAGRGECIFGSAEGNETARPRCKCFDETDTSVGCSDTFVLDGKYLRDAGTLTDKLKTSFFEPLIAVFVDHPDTWTTSSWAWAAALFVVFLLMILCICSSFWPEKEKKRPEMKSRQRYAV